MRNLSLGPFLVCMSLVGCNSDPGVEPNDAAVPVPLRGAVTGKVLMAGVSDLSGFPVTLVGPGTAAAVTDAAGVFSAEHLPPGRYLVSVMVSSTLEGSRATAVEVGEESAAAPDLVFTPLGDLTGKVTLGTPTGNAGIAVVVAGTDSSGVTDDSGSYVIRGVRAGAHDIVAARPGWSSGAAKAIEIAYRKLTTAPELVLARPPADAGSLSGTVTLTGESTHAGVTIVAVGPTASGAAITEPAGGWTMSGLPPGTYTLTANAPSTVEGSRGATATIESGKASTVDALGFTPLGTLRGKATLAGRTSGNAGIAVWVPDAPVALTDDTGNWEIRGARTGVSTIRASKEGYSLRAIAGPKLAWRAVATTDSLDLAIDPSTTTRLTGVAKIPGRTTHDGIEVSVSGSATTTTTLADGSYAFDVPGTGVRTVWFRSKDGRYEARVSDVMLMPGGAAFVVSGSTLLPIPKAKLARGKWIGEGRAFGRAPSGEIAVAVEGPKGRLDLISMTGATKNLVGADLTASGFGPRMSPDGAQIVFEANVAGTASWSLVPTAGGGAETLGSGGRFYYGYRPEFVAGGKLLAYVVSEGSRRVLNLRTIATGKSTRIGEVNPDMAGWAWSFSDDGAWLAYPSGYFGVTLTPPSGGGSTVAPLEESRHGWTFDGRFVNRRSTVGGLPVLVVMTPGSLDAPRVLFDGVERWEMSPDGRWIVAWRWSGAKKGVWLASLATSEPATLIGEYTGGYGSEPLAAFSTDSTLAAFSFPDFGKSSVRMVKLAASSSPTLLGEVPTNGMMRFLGTSALVFGAGFDDGGFGIGAPLHLLPTSGGGSITLSSAGRAGIWPSPDASRLAWIDADGTLRLATPTGAVVSLATKAQWPVRWSPDSTRLAAVLCPDECYSALIDPTGASPPVPLAWDLFPVMWLSSTQALLTAWRSEPAVELVPAGGPIFVAAFP